MNDITPACTVLPGKAEEVSTAVKVLNAGFSASVKGCQFAIRSGGSVSSFTHTKADGTSGLTVPIGTLLSKEQTISKVVSRSI